MPFKRTIPQACEQCGHSFPALVYEVRRGGGRFCGQACSREWHRLRKIDHYRRTFTERFWARVNKRSGHFWDGTECWEWTGARSGGYGFVATQDRGNQHTQRIAWELTHGPIPSGIHACHHCDNPPCCRPDHLFLGDDAANAQDKQAKGRATAPRGSANRNAKLTDDAVRDIRLRLDAGNTATTLAREYGVSDVSIGNIRRRRTWKQVA
jgi:hypothetical protein